MSDKPIQVKKKVYLTNYASWDAFAVQFRDGVNPILEWKRNKHSMVGGGAGDFAVVLTMHHDMDEPFLVELPWSRAIAQFICTNQVEIAILPDIE